MRKKAIIALFSVMGLLIGVQQVLAAPTSTTVQNLFINGLSSTPAAVLTLGANNLVSGNNNFTFNTATQNLNVPIIDGWNIIPAGLSQDLGTYMSSTYNTSANSITFFIGTSTSFANPVAFNTNGKYGNIVCAPGVVLTYTGIANGNGVAITKNDGQAFPEQANQSSNCILNSNVSFPLTNATSVGWLFGGTHGAIAFNLDGWTVTGFGKAWQLASNTYMLSLTHNVFKNNTSDGYIDPFNNSGEDTYVGYNYFVEPSANPTFCFYIAPNGVSNATIIGNSFDDCQDYYDAGNVDVYLAGNHHENSNTPVYGSYIMTVFAGPGSATQVADVYQNDASSTGSSPQYYEENLGDFVNIQGIVYDTTDHITIPTAIFNTDGGKLMYQGITNENGNSFTYAVNSSTQQSVDNSLSGFPESHPSSTFYGNVTTTNLTVSSTVSALGSFSSSGVLSAYAGSSCVAGSLVTSISATGTVSCITTSTILAGYSTSTGGGGSVTTSSAVTANEFPYWANTTGGLAGTSTLFYATSTGFVGIGTTTPGDVLSLVASTSFNGISPAALDFGTGVAGLVAQISPDSITATSSQLFVNFANPSNGSLGNFLAYRFGSANNKFWFGDNGANAFMETIHPLFISASGNSITPTLGITVQTNGDVSVATSTDLGLFSVTNASNTNVFQAASTTNNSNSLTIAGHTGFATSSVSVTSCGTGSPTVLGSDETGAIVTGTSASSCTLNFAKNYVNPPVCVVSDSNTTAVTDVSSVSSSSVTFSLASALSAVNMYYVCFGNPQ